MRDWSGGEPRSFVAPAAGDLEEGDDAPERSSTPSLPKVGRDCTAAGLGAGGGRGGGGATTWLRMEREGRSSSGERSGLVGVAGGLVEDGRREEAPLPDDSDSKNRTKSCESEVDCRGINGRSRVHDYNRQSL